MAIDLNSIYSGSNQWESLIQNTVELEREPIYRLEDKKEVLSSKKTTLSTLDTKLSSLFSKTEYLTDPIFDYFSTKSASSSDENVFTVDAGVNSVAGNHSIEILRLAESDVRYSKVWSDDESTFNQKKTDNENNGNQNDNGNMLFEKDQTITFSVYHPVPEEEIEETGDASDNDNGIGNSDSNTEESSDANRFEISLTIEADTFNGTNREVLEAIQKKINNAMSDAALDGDIETAEKITASVVSQNKGESRLVLQSGNSGADYMIEFEDSKNGLMSYLGLTKDAGKFGDGQEYGYKKSEEDLSALLKVDGLEYKRNTNSVNDILFGSTINLLDKTDGRETISIKSDNGTVKNDITEFIDNFNEVQTFLKSSAQMDPNTYERGPLATDGLYRNLASDLRSIAFTSVSSARSSSFKKLYDIGIGFNSTGELHFEDSSKFTNALDNNSRVVADIFRSDNGIATRIGAKVKQFTRTNGFIDGSHRQIESNVSYLDSQISRMEDQLDRREQQLREQYARMQSSMTQLSNQSNYLGSYYSGGSNYGLSY